jgi:hypothetical protein
MSELHPGSKVLHFRPIHPTPATDRQVPHTRRQHRRVPGPFTGKRGGFIPVAIHIHDLSTGGCLIQCFHEEALGKRITFHVELPYAGWVTLHAEVRDIRPEYGYAVEFVDMSEETRAILDDVIERVLMRSPSDDV